MTTVQQELPLAIVEGQPINDMPQDLYIPPDALSVILEAFGFGESNDIQPVLRCAFAESFGGQQVVDELFIRIR